MTKTPAMTAITACLFLSLRFCLVVWVDGCFRETLANQTGISPRKEMLEKSSGIRFGLEGKHQPKRLYTKDGASPAAHEVVFSAIPKQSQPPPCFKAPANARILGAFLRAPPFRPTLR